MTPEFPELQRWLQTVIVEPGNLARKLEQARTHDGPGLGIGDVVAHRGGAPVERRVGIYVRGYVMRLIDCLRTDFPALTGFLGESVFDAFAQAYVLEHPSSSPSLFDLGAGFADFLDRTRPRGEELDEPQRALLDLPGAIARLERAGSEALRAPGLEAERPGVVSSPVAWEILSEDLWVAAAPCLRLLDLPFPVVGFVEALERGEWPDPPAPSMSLVAVSRSRYRLTRQVLETWQHRFLAACSEPARVGELASALVPDATTDPGALLAQLVIWLPAASDTGLVSISAREARIEVAVDRS